LPTSKNKNPGVALVASGFFVGGIAAAGGILDMAVVRASMVELGVAADAIKSYLVGHFRLSVSPYF